MEHLQKCCPSRNESNRISNTTAVTRLESGIEQLNNYTVVGLRLEQTKLQLTFSVTVERGYVRVWVAVGDKIFRAFGE